MKNLAVTEKGYEYLAELARKRKPIVISAEDWDRYYLGKPTTRKGVLIDGDPNMRAALGKPCYYMASKTGEAKELVIYQEQEHAFDAKHLAAVQLQCEPGEIELRGPFERVG
jgi:hypothetical protein